MMEHNDANTEQEHPSAATPLIAIRRSFSMVWLIPLIALLVGGWLVFKAVSERGHIIYISFEAANGIEAGKTKVKFKDVDIGIVESIKLDEALGGVTVKVEMEREVEPYLREDSKFWLVRARLSAGNVTGLETLLGGVYIGIDPSENGKKTRRFKGMENPPIVTQDMEGKHFYLNAQRLGSINPGSPIYFRQIKVGKVVEFKLDEQGGDVEIHIFVDSPYDQFVRKDTRFWNASGLDLAITSDGLQVDTESIVSLMIGGIAFNSFSEEVSTIPASENTYFELYDTRNQAMDSRYTVTSVFYVEFANSVRGLSKGAPVEFRGLRIGEVREIELKPDFKNLEFKMMVGIQVENQRISMPIRDEKDSIELLHRMVAKGFRAQMETGNLLTGQLYIKLDYFKDAAPADITQYKGFEVLPSIPSNAQQFREGMVSILSKLETVPLDEIGRDIQKAVQGLEKLVNNPNLQQTPDTLQSILTEIEATTQQVNSGTVPGMNSALVRLEKLLGELEEWANTDAHLYSEMSEALANISKAARAVNDMADLLERQPESLIQGKNTGGQP